MYIQQLHIAIQKDILKKKKKNRYSKNYLCPENEIVIVEPPKTVQKTYFSPDKMSDELSKCPVISS